MIPKNSINMLASLNIFSLPITRQDVSPYDDEDQLATEIACSLHESTLDQLVPDINPDDFEKLYQWFLSLARQS